MNTYRVVCDIAGDRTALFIPRSGDPADAMAEMLTPAFASTLSDLVGCPASAVFVSLDE